MSQLSPLSQESETPEADPIRLIKIKPGGVAWQDRLLGSPVLIFSILLHVVIIGLGIFAYQHFMALYRANVALALKNQPLIEYPVKIAVKKKVIPPPDDAPGLAPGAYSSIPPVSGTPTTDVQVPDGPIPPVSSTSTKVPQNSPDSSTTP